MTRYEIEIAPDWRLWCPRGSTEPFWFSHHALAVAVFLNLYAGGRPVPGFRVVEVHEDGTRKSWDYS